MVVVAPVAVAATVFEAVALVVAVAVVQDLMKLIWNHSHLDEVYY